MYITMNIGHLSNLYPRQTHVDFDRGVVAGGVAEIYWMKNMVFLGVSVYYWMGLASASFQAHKVSCFCSTVHTIDVDPQRRF